MIDYCNDYFPNSNCVFFKLQTVFLAINLIVPVEKQKQIRKHHLIIRFVVKGANYLNDYTTISSNVELLVIMVFTFASTMTREKKNNTNLKRFPHTKPINRT